MHPPINVKQSEILFYRIKKQKNKNFKKDYPEYYISATTTINNYPTIFEVIVDDVGDILEIKFLPLIYHNCLQFELWDIFTKYVPKV